MEARWTNVGELQSRLSLSLSLSPAPRTGERAVVILVHQKLLFCLRPSYCAFNFCFCFCCAGLLLLPWIRVTVLSCLAPVHPFIPHCCFNGPKQPFTIFLCSLYGVWDLLAFFCAISIICFLCTPGTKL